MPDLNKSELENVSKVFLIAFQEILSWKWDSRFETVLAEFFIDNKDKVRAILERYFSITCDSSNIGKAPDIVQMIANNFGGLRPGQLLFISDPNQDFFIYGVWWPWGDGKTISLRVGPYSKKLSGAEKAELIKQFKGWFGL